MSRLYDLHEQALDLADEADLARQQGLGKANELFKRAYTIELQVAQQVDHEPSRSVLYRSAALLALDCGLFNEAHAAALAGLGGQPPIEIYQELREILAEVDSRQQATHTLFDGD